MSLFPRSQAHNFHDSMLIGSTLSNYNETPNNLLSGGSILAGLGDLSESQVFSNLENNLKRLGPLPSIHFDNV